VSKWYRLSAGQGNAIGQHALGVLYENGIGVPKDFQEAIKWYRLSADQGNAIGQYSLGALYDNGQGVPKDSQEALKWFRLSAAQGYAEAQSILGRWYLNGNGIPKDFQEAFKWLRLSANQGSPSGQYALGLLYDNGQGVTKDSQEALKWFRLSAEQGYVGGQYELGKRYLNGQGVPKDDQEAGKWLAKAAAQGNTSDAQAPSAMSPIFQRLFSSVDDAGKKLVGDLAACSREVRGVSTDHSRETEYEKKSEQCKATWARLFESMFAGDETKFLWCYCRDNSYCGYGASYQAQWIDSAIRGYNGKFAEYASSFLGGKILEDKYSRMGNRDYEIINRCMSERTLKLFSVFDSAYKREFKDIAWDYMAQQQYHERERRRLKAEEDERQLQAWRKKLSSKMKTNKGVVVGIKGDEVTIEKSICLHDHVSAVIFNKWGPLSDVRECDQWGSDFRKYSRNELFPVE
jgi:hypothetical protein